MIPTGDLLMQESGADEGWQIENDQQADWAVQKIKEAKAECDKWITYYEAMIEKVKREYIYTSTFMNGKLQDYFSKVPHKESKTQEKYSLPSGDLILKRPKNVWAHDDKELIRWARENCFAEYIKVTESLNWAELKKRLTEDENGVIYEAETGLVCDGVKSIIQDAEFVVSTKD